MRLTEKQALEELRWLEAMKIKGPGLEWGDDLSQRLQVRRERINYLKSLLNWYKGGGMNSPGVKLLIKKAAKRKKDAILKASAARVRWKRESAKEVARRAKEFIQKRDAGLTLLDRKT